MTSSLKFIIILIVLSIQLLAQDRSRTFSKSVSPVNNQLDLGFELKKEQILNKNGFLRYSLISGFLARKNVIHESCGRNYTIQVDTTSGIRILSMWNLSIVDMFTHGYLFPTQVILKVKNPSKFVYDSQKESEVDWLKKNAHCYQLVIPDAGFDIISIAERDMEFLLNLKVTKEVRKMNVITLMSINRRSNKLKNFPKVDKSHIPRSENISLEDLIYKVNRLAIAPVINGTNYKGKVKIDAKLLSCKDYSQLKTCFSNWGFEIVEDYRDMEVIVISDKI
ncbi:hypothetical protein SAMN06265348_1187 [Pedobacter westerhofensis]|uniref:Uncharacterized protein n=1 Tax=Pedobacter westerhofensis TaxID=425512 RepID=A0A521FRW3_9SPHI|nr:hypothetical protein [Pedobacter westerhofensis]SMO98856.1 hypothetical protein SAMN06265348_1187 [Pedobacter westerhofensis]